MKKFLFPITLVILFGVYLAVNYLYLAVQPPSKSDLAVQQLGLPEEEISLSVIPEAITQGEPVLIAMSGMSIAEVESLSVDGKNLGVFLHAGKPSALIGIDLRGRVGTYPLILKLADGREVRKNLIVNEREIITAPLGIPDKLGGNTPEAEQELINTLVQEAALINSIPSEARKLWEGTFRYPIDLPITITDTYGYSRQTGGSSISHKGTDFRAAIGTPVYAMNSGAVRFSSLLRNYGHTVIIDHGFGLHTVYMHLSERSVALGEEVAKGELVGRSGDTGYVLGPHLHLSVRIDGISIDPMKFMEIFGEDLL